MAIIIRCETCGRTYHVAADAGLTELQCSCGCTVPIPGASEGAPRRPIRSAPPPPTRPPTTRERIASAAEHTVAIARHLSVVLPWALPGLMGLVAALVVAPRTNLDVPIWMAQFPRIPAWTWAVAPLAGMAVTFFHRRERRPGAMAAIAGVVVGLLLVQGIFLAINAVGFEHRSSLREHPWIDWGLAWAVAGALGGMLAGAFARWSRHTARIALDLPVRRVTAGVIGLLAGIAIFLGTHVMPDLADGSVAHLMEHTQVALVGLSAVLAGALTLLATDLGAAHDLGARPVLGALIGLAIGYQLEPVLELDGTWALVGVVAVPVGSALAGMAAGIVTSPRERPRRIALAGLLVCAVGLAIGVRVRVPSAEAIEVTALIGQAEAARDSDALQRLRQVHSPGAVPVLIDALESPDTQVAAAAADALGQIGDERAIDPLAEVMLDSDRGRQLHAARALQRIGGPEVIEHLTRMLRSEDMGLVRDAARVLADLGEPGTTPLLEMAESNDSERRSIALWALERSEADSPVADSMLFDALEDQDPAARAAAIRRLGSPEHREMFEKVAEAASDESASIRRAAVEALGGMADPRAIETLKEALPDSDRVTGRRAALGLLNIGTSEAIAALKRAIESENWFASESAAYAYGQMGTREAVEALIDLMRRNAIKDRGHSASTVLANMRDLPKDLILPLIEDENPEVRSRAVSAVQRVCEGRPEMLVPYLKHEDPDVRKMATWMIVDDFCVEGDISLIMHMLGDPDRDVRATALRVIQDKAQKSPAALTAAFSHKEERVVAGAAEIAGEIGMENAAKHLRRVLREHRGPAATAAARSLGLLKVQEAEDELIEALGGGKAPTRAQAAWALGRLKSENAIGELIDALSDTSEDVRGNASGSLGAIGKPAIPALEKAARSSDSWVSGGARTALRNIDDPAAKAALERAEAATRPPDPSSHPSGIGIPAPSGPSSSTNPPVTLP